MPAAPFLPHLEADTAGAVPGRVVHPHLVISKTDRAQVVKDIDRRRLPDRDTEHPPLPDRMLVQRQIVLVEMDGGIQRVFHESDARNVVDVRVRQQNVHHIEAVIPDHAEQLVSLVTRVDNDGFARALAADDKPILVRRGDGPDFENQSTTIIST